jgi:hypothetical protein
MQSIFQFRYAPEDVEVWVTSTSGLIGFKVEVERPTCLILKQGGIGDFDLRVFSNQAPARVPQAPCPHFLN